MKKLIFISLFLSAGIMVHAQLKVLSSGFVGAQTTNPLSSFQIRDDYTKIAFGSANYSALNWGTSYIGFNVVRRSDNNTWLSINDGSSANGGSIIFGSLDGAINFIPISSTGNSPQSNSDATIYSKRAMVIAGNGNVGIGMGTSSPNNLLQVAGLINFDNTLYNTFLGYQSGYTNTAGTRNTFAGYQSGKLSTANYNSFYGSYSGVNNSTGEANTFSGAWAGNSNTTAGYNAFYGYKAGYSNTSGQNNTFTGYKAGYSNTTAHYNSFYGTLSGLYNTGNYNTFTGYAAGINNTTGYNNTFTGYDAGIYNTTGYNNTFIGFYSGSSNVSGYCNTFIGDNASANGNYNNATAIGSSAVVTASNHIMIGSSTVTEIGGYAGWTNYSDGRFKTNVQENVKGLAFIMKLRPVTYQLNTQQLDAFIKQNMPQQTDSSGNPLTIPAGNFSESMAIIHSGFIAQEVEQAEIETGLTSSIVSKPSNNNDAYSLAYGEIVVPLVKAVQELKYTIDSLKTLQKITDSLNTDLQKILNTTIADMQQQINNCCIASTTKEMELPQSTNSNTNNISGNKTAYLLQNIPNPFNTKTTIRYYIPENTTSANLMIFDMQGKLIKTYPVNSKKEGFTEINGGEMQPGMYMYSLIIDGQEIDTKRMILTN